MTTKEKLAIEYINLKKQFEGDNFEENLTDNQVWYLTKRNTITDFKHKIEDIKKAIDDKDMELKKEAYFLTPEGQDYKKKIEDLIANYRADWKKIRDDFENWIINKVNEMAPGNWTARLSLLPRCRVVADCIVVDFRNLKVCPVGHFHCQPMAISL